MLLEAHSTRAWSSPPGESVVPRVAPNFGVKLMRPGFGPAAELPPRRQRDGVTTVAVRHAVLRTSLAATAAPLRLRHAGPAAQLTPRTLGRRKDSMTSPAPPSSSFAARADVVACCVRQASAEHVAECLRPGSYALTL